MPAAAPPTAPLARAELDQFKLARLRHLLATILPANAFYAAKLARVPVHPESLAELEAWPFTYKEEFVAGSHAGTPANLTWSADRYVRFHQTSGTHGRPLPVFDTADDWAWWMECWRAVLDRGSVRAGDRKSVV